MASDSEFENDADVSTQDINLMDVLNITYYGAEPISPMEQLGTIKVNSTHGFQYLYKVEEVDMSKLPIRNGDPILLTPLAPTITFDDFDDFVILEFDLFCGTFKGSVRFNTGIADGEAFSMQEQLMSTDNLRMILVQIGHYANATTATVEVHLLDNSIATSVVHGAVFATNSRLDTPNCASVLFLDNSCKGLKVGPNDKIRLSRSCVGVPLDSDLCVHFSLYLNGHHYTAFPIFKAKQHGNDMEPKATDDKVKFYVKVSWNANEETVLQTYESSDPNKAKERGEPKATDDKEFSRLTARLSVNPTVLSTKRMIILFSSEGDKFEVEEKVALGFTLLMGQIEDMVEDKHVCLHTNITKNILSEVINYCKYLAHPFSSQIAFDDGYLKQLSPVKLFNLIEAAHELQIKGLMDLTCFTLANVLREKKDREADGMFLRRDKSFSMYALEQKRCMIFSMVCSPSLHTFAAEQLRLVGRWDSVIKGFVNILEQSLDVANSDLKKLLFAVQWLDYLVNGDPLLSYQISRAGFQCLLNILVGIDSCKEDKDMFNIQMYSVRILSHNSNQQDFLKVVVQAFVKLMSNPSNVFKSLAVMALTRLALNSEDRVLNILQEGALEKALEIVKELNLLFVEDSELMHWIALFMAVVCRFIASLKVKVFLTISEEIFQKHSLNDHRHIMPTCFALQCFLGRPSAIEEEEFRKFISWLSVLIINYLEVEFPRTAVITSILGVVQSIVIGGNVMQVQIINEGFLLNCIGRILLLKSKRLLVEACTIVSDIGARLNRKEKVMDVTYLIDPLCDLLQSFAGYDCAAYDFSVKVQAAKALLWAAPCYEEV